MFSTSTDVVLLVREDNLHEAAILILYEVIYLNSNEKLEEYHEIGKGGLWGELSCINVKHVTSSQQRAVSWLGQTPLGRELTNLIFKN